MASNLKVDIVRPTATNGDLSLKGDSGGSATTNGITVDSSGNTSITGTTTIAEAQIDNININGNTISSTNDTISIAPASSVVNVKGSNSGGTITLKVFNETTNVTGSRTQILMPVFNGASGFSITSDSNATDGYNAFLTTGQTIGQLIFGSGAGIERMRIDSGGNVRIGPSGTPSAKLHVVGGDILFEDTAPILKLKDSDSVATEFNGYIEFVDSTNTRAGYIGYGTSSNSNLTINNALDGDLDFRTNNVERMRIDSSGDVELKTTNAKLILPSGGGISFENHSVSSATGASSTASDNVLDDYEEGTWTATISDSQSPRNLSSTSVTGNYIKIGNLVHANFVGLNNISTSGLTSTDIVCIYGLPFTTTSRPSTHTLRIDALDLGVGRTFICGTITDNVLELRSSGSNLQDTVLTVSRLTSGSTDIVDFSITYYVA